MKILVLGSAGMLGHVVTLYLRECGYKVVDVSRNRKINKETLLFDVLEKEFFAFILEQNFDIVINCIALLVKDSEKNKADAIKLNAYFPHYLESLFKETRTRIIQVSTDGVFSGNAAPYQENDWHDAKLFYARTKSLGELENEKDLTIRASIVGGDMWVSGVGLFNWFVKQRADVYGYKGTVFNAVTTVEFAKFVEHAIRTQLSGICHLGAKSSISKADFLFMIKRYFGLSDLNILKVNHTATDHTLVSNREDLNYSFSDYDEMLLELRQWMLSHIDLYQHYKFLRR